MHVSTFHFQENGTIQVQLEQDGDAGKQLLACSAVELINNEGHLIQNDCLTVPWALTILIIQALPTSGGGSESLDRCVCNLLCKLGNAMAL